MLIITFTLAKIKEFQGEKLKEQNKLEQLFLLLLTQSHGC